MPEDGNEGKGRRREKVREGERRRGRAGEDGRRRARVCEMHLGEGDSLGRALARPLAILPIALPLAPQLLATLDNRLRPRDGSRRRLARRLRLRRRRRDPVRGALLGLRRPLLGNLRALPARCPLVRRHPRLTLNPLPTPRLYRTHSARATVGRVPPATVGKSGDEWRRVEKSACMHCSSAATVCAPWPDACT